MAFPTPFFRVHDGFVYWFRYGDNNTSTLVRRAVAYGTQPEVVAKASSPTFHIADGRISFVRDKAIWSAPLSGGGVQDAPWLCPPFPASCPFSGVDHSVSGPRHIEKSLDIAPPDEPTRPEATQQVARLGEAQKTLAPTPRTSPGRLGA